MKNKNSYQILKKSVTPDGVEIQIEDWGGVYDFQKVPVLACYPVGNKKPDGVYFYRAGEKFRATICKFETFDDVQKAFDDLENGVKTIFDFMDLFAPYCVGVPVSAFF